MQPALLTRLRPSGPWRYGPIDGAPGGVDMLYRSDRLFSAVTLAMQRLGHLEDWLDATARSSEPTVAFSSLFPFQGDTLFAIPPATIWPPPTSLVTAPNAVFLAKIRWDAVSFVPLSVIDALLTGGGILADQWLPDPESGCLLRRDRPSTSPFRTVLRRSAAVDRITETAHSLVTTACVEFEAGAGLWTVTRFRDDATRAAWQERVEGAFRLLADTGFGGRRTSGWGHAQAPEFQRGSWPGLLLPKLARGSRNGSAPGDAGATNDRESSKYWLLSLYSPAAGDRVDWADGDYALAIRAGRVESNGRSGEEKKALRMIVEGSVVVAPVQPAGAAVDVAPDNFEHPVYRSGLALALALPRFVPQSKEDLDLEARPAEEPATEEALVDRPCDETAAAHENTDPVLEGAVEPDPETASEPPVKTEVDEAETNLVEQVIPETAAFAEPAADVTPANLVPEPPVEHVPEQSSHQPLTAEGVAETTPGPTEHPEAEKIEDPVLEPPIEPDPETASEPPVKVETPGDLAGNGEPSGEPDHAL